MCFFFFPLCSAAFWGGKNINKMTILNCRGLYRLPLSKTVYDSYIYMVEKWKHKLALTQVNCRESWRRKKTKRTKAISKSCMHIYIYIHTKNQNFIGFKVAGVSHIGWIKGDDYEHYMLLIPWSLAARIFLSSSLFFFPFQPCFTWVRVSTSHKIKKEKKKKKKQSLYMPSRVYQRRLHHIEALMTPSKSRISADNHHFHFFF